MTATADPSARATALAALDAETLAAITLEVFETVAGLPLEPDPRLDLRAGAGGVDPVVGIVHITGTVDGAVVLSLDHDLARRSAAAMFDVPAADVAQADLMDAVGELANVVGGNVKGLLPPPNQLSLPSVVPGATATVRTPGAEPVASLAFAPTTGADGGLLLSVWLGEPADAP